MNKFCYLDVAHKLLERIEESIVERKGLKSNDQLFTEAEIHITDTFLKAVFCDGISEGMKRKEAQS